MIPNMVYTVSDTILRNLGAAKLLELAYSQADTCFNFAKDPYKAADICRTLLSNPGAVGACSTALSTATVVLGAVLVAGATFVTINTVYRTFQDIRTEQQKPRSLLDMIKRR